MPKYVPNQHKARYGNNRISNCDTLINQIAGFYDLHEKGYITINSADLRTILTMVSSIEKFRKYIPDQERFEMYEKFYSLENRYIKSSKIR